MEAQSPAVCSAEAVIETDLSDMRADSATHMPVS